MKLVHVQGTLPSLDDFLGACCLDGRFGLEPASQYMSASLGYAPLNEEDPYTPLVERIESLAAQIGAQLPELEPGRPQGLRQDRQFLDELAQKFAALRAERDSLQDQQRLCEDAIAQYSHFLSLKANVDEITGCDHVKVRFGFLPQAGYNKLMSSYADDPYILFVPCSQTPEGYWGIYLTPRSRSQETDGIFSMLYFEPLRVPGAAGSPAEIVEHFRENLEVVQKSLDDIDARVRELWENHEEKIGQLYAAARYQAAVFSLRHFAAVKGQHFFCVGWVPEREVDDIVKKARETADLRVTVDDPDKAGRYTPPTKLRNAWFVRPFEFFVEMYGLPNYDETDATPFVALTFTVLFGIMFGDVGQGIVLTLFSLFMWKVKKNALFHLLIPCGIASTCAGFVYGSFFGYEELLDPALPRPWHGVQAGLGHGFHHRHPAVRRLHRRRARAGRHGHEHLYPVAAGPPGQRAVRHQQRHRRHHLPRRCRPGQRLHGRVGVHAGAAGRRSCRPGAGLAALCRSPGSARQRRAGLAPRRGWGGYLMQNVFELLESVLSYLSNTISFLRVGAFVIVHASMMMVVFTLAGEPANLIVVVLGNGVVIALEALLSAIQGIRLEFYEMFSRFYTGGGRKFEDALSQSQPG